VFRLPSEVQLIAWALAAACALGGLAWFIHHEREIGASSIRAAVTEAGAKAESEAASETERRVAASQETVHVAQTQLAAASAAAGAAERERTALRVQLAAIRARVMPGHPASAPSSPSDDPIGVLATVLGDADDFAGRVAAEADANRIAGDACVRAYDSLTH
jgi:hypothetical protein